MILKTKLLQTAQLFTKSYKTNRPTKPKLYLNKSKLTITTFRWLIGLKIRLLANFSATLSPS